MTTPQTPAEQAAEEAYRESIRPDGVSRGAEDAAEELGIEPYGHPVNPMTGKGRPTIRFQDFLAGAKFGSASREGEISEILRGAEVLRECLAAEHRAALSACEEKLGEMERRLHECSKGD